MNAKRKLENADMVDGPGVQARVASVQKLREIYDKTIKPLELKYRHVVANTVVDDTLDKSTVLLVGNNGTGKTTFVKSVTGKDYGDCQSGAGVESTRISIIKYGSNDFKLTGIPLIHAWPEYSPLRSAEGEAFVEGRLFGATLASDKLKEITLIDTPGDLTSKGMVGALKWLCDQADMVIFFFDQRSVKLCADNKGALGSFAKAPLANGNLTDIIDHCLDRGMGNKVWFLANKCDSLSHDQYLRFRDQLNQALGNRANQETGRRLLFTSYSESGRITSNIASKADCKDFQNDKNILDCALASLKEKNIVQKVNRFKTAVEDSKRRLLVLGELRKKLSWEFLLPLNNFQIPLIGRSWTVCHFVSPQDILKDFDKIFLEACGEADITKGDQDAFMSNAKEFFKDKLRDASFYNTPSLSKKDRKAILAAVDSINALFTKMLQPVTTSSVSKRTRT